MFVRLNNDTTVYWDVHRKRKPDVNIDEIVFIQVCGPELDVVRAFFENLPFPRKTNSLQNVWWYGDMAKFIFGNFDPTIITKQRNKV